ncbi:MAG: hypothetical protein H6757_02700 [Candidatus Omnitrophica bacterium]|nr:hypothetical protein [Candidatus Omnitrophota bacterium]
MRKRRELLRMIVCLFWMTGILHFPLKANEVIPETQSEVIVREHPQTGDPYIVIKAQGDEGREDLHFGQPQKYSRPDYEMLRSSVKPGDVAYDGPVSSRKKIYILAASLATLGTVSGVAGAALFPAAAGTTASGSGAGLAAGVAVTGAATAAASIALNQEIPDDYVREQESRLLEMQTDFYQRYVAPHQISPVESNRSQ